MRILLDENFPADFSPLLVGHQTSNVHSHGWAGIKNGELLRRAHGVCEVFVTLDRNLEFQQNTKILPFGIVVVRARSNRIVDLKPYIPDILFRLCFWFGWLATLLLFLAKVVGVRMVEHPPDKI